MSKQLREIHGRLGDEAQKLTESKTLEGARPWREWVELLDPLHAMDQETDRVRSRATTQMITAGILAFLLLIGTIFALVASPIAGAICVVILLGLIAWFFAAMRTRGYTKRIDLERAPLDFVLPLLPILGEDAERGAPVSLRVDLREPTRPDNRGQSSQPYAKGRYHKIVDTWYTHPWCAGGVRFVDGAVVQWQIVDYIKVAKKTKRNPRGKIKTKTKSKKRSQLEVAATFPAKMYEATDQARWDRQVKEKVKPAESKTAIRVRRTVKSTDVASPPDVRHLLDLLASAYERVEPTRGKKLAG